MNLGRITLRSTGRNPGRNQRSKQWKNSGRNPKRIPGNPQKYNWKNLGRNPQRKPVKNRYRNLGNSIKKSWDECSIKSRNELIKEKRDKSLKEFLRIIPVSISKEKPLNIPEECHYKPGRDLLTNYDGIPEGIAEEIPEKKNNCANPWESPKRNRCRNPRTNP